MSARLRVALVGASGRMGRAITRLAEESGCEVTATISEGQDLGDAARSGADVAVDFSSPEATASFALLAAAAKMPLVIGTTGLEGRHERALEEAARSVPVFVASNMSVGVFVLADLAARARRMLGDDFDVEIVEAHHRRKVDAPSGTALTLLAALKEASPSTTVFGRSGKPGARPRGEIGLHAVRGGDVVGDHHVLFMGEGERLELVHRATSRDVFAQGALRAARWVVGKPAGRYGMADLFR